MGCVCFWFFKWRKKPSETKTTFILSLGGKDIPRSKRTKAVVAATTEPLTHTTL